MFVCSFVRSNGSFATFARVLDTYDSHCGFCALRYLRRRPPPLDFSLSRTVAFAVFFFSKVFCGVELARKRTRSSVMALVPQGCVHGMFLRLLITSYRCFSRFCSDQDLLLRISPEIVAKWASAASGHVHERFAGTSAAVEFDNFPVHLLSLGASQYCRKADHSCSSYPKVKVPTFSHLLPPLYNLLREKLARM